MKITVQIRSVYGNETIYPACKQSVLFCGLARTKTITQEIGRASCRERVLYTV